MANCVRNLIKDEHLRIKLENIWNKIKEEFEPANKGDTLQGLKHFKNVEKNLCTLVRGKDLDDLELFLLSASAALHDIAKPVEESGDHGELVVDVLKNLKIIYGLNRAEAVAIGWIAAAHNKRTFRTKYGDVPEKFSIGSNVVNLKKLAAIFILADALDTTCERTSNTLKYLYYPKGFPDKKIEGKWIAREAITGWLVNDYNEIEIQAIPETPEEEEAVVRAVRMIEDELNDIIPILKQFGFPHEFKVKIGEIFVGKKIKEIVSEHRPFRGMDFYDESDVELFKGRDEDIKKLEGFIYTYPVTLLVGDSGVGKTSIVRAGLFPRLKRRGWTCIWLRPLDNLDNLIKQIKKIYNIEAKNLVQAFREINKMFSKVLVVVDQFEDVLPYLSTHTTIVNQLIDDLTAIYNICHESLKLLIVTRSDSLCDLNRLVFKKVLPNGFPTFELGKLKKDGAKDALDVGFKAARLQVDKSFIDDIVSDLISIGEFDEVYPPYLQMVGEELCKQANKSGIVNPEVYRQLGGAENIVSEYLLRRIEEFGDDKEFAIKILKTLVSHKGRKLSRKRAEIKRETLIDDEILERVLNQLIDERMVRKLDDRYEIIHDYFGERVNKEFLSDRERHIKYLKELIVTYASAFENSGILIPRQIAGELYLYRKEITIDDIYIFKVLIATWLSGDAAIWYWLRNLPKSQRFEIIKELFNHPVIGVEAKCYCLSNFYDLLNEGERLELVAELLDTDNIYTVANALHVISINRERKFIGKIVELIRYGGEFIQSEAGKTFVEVVEKEDINLIKTLLEDKSPYIREIGLKALGEVCNKVKCSSCREILYREIKSYFEDEDPNVAIEAIKLYGKLTNKKILSFIANKLDDTNARTRIIAIRSLVELANREGYNVDVIRTLIKGMLNDRSSEVRNTAKVALLKLATRKDLDFVIEQLKSEDEIIMNEAGEAIFNLVTAEDLPTLKEFLNKNKDIDTYVKLDIMKTLAKLGDKSVLSTILKLIREVPEDLLLYMENEITDILALVCEENDLDALAKLTKEFGQIGDLVMRALIKVDEKLYKN